MTLSSGGVAGTLAIGGNLTVTGNSTWYARDSVSGGGKRCKAALFTLASGAEPGTTPARERHGRGHRGGRRYGYAQRQPELHQLHEQHVYRRNYRPQQHGDDEQCLAMPTLSGSSNYGGGTTIQAGNAAVGQQRRPGAGTGAVVNLGGLLDLNGFNAGVCALNGGGTIHNVAGVGASTLTFGNGVRTGTFSGTIQNSLPSGTVALVKTVAGMRFSAASTPTAAARPSPPRHAGHHQCQQPRTVERRAFDRPGHAGSIRGCRFDCNIALTAPSSTISVDLLQSYSNSGTISGNGGLTVSGQGLLVLSGSNNYSGGTHVTVGHAATRQ